MNKEKKDNLINKYAKYVVNSHEYQLGDVLENMLNEYDHQALTSYTEKLKKMIESKKGDRFEVSKLKESGASKSKIDRAIKANNVHNQTLQDVLSELNHK